MGVRDEPFRCYSRYLRDRYNATVFRVGIDGGFTCPNRSPDRLSGGCSYCAASGARATYLDKAASIADQARRGVAFARKRYKASVFILYFQAFSSTNASPAELRRRYDAGLSAGDFRELVVSTRPDCIDREKAALLASYLGPRRDVWVELGLQSANDETLARIGRGHDAASFFTAFSILKKAGIKVAVHLVFGLPGETRDDMMRTVDRVAEIGADGVKLHNLTVSSSSRLWKPFVSGELTVPCEARHRSYVIEALQRLPPETVIMRLTCDRVKGEPGGPRKFPSKQGFYAALRAEMIDRNIRQGSRFAGRIGI